MPKNAQKSLPEIRNRKAGAEYFIGETFEAGLVLSGTEVKSLRNAKAQINDAFVRVDNGEPIMYQSHISVYDFGNLNNHSPDRPRKLLLNKKEILKLKAATDRGGFAIIPLKIYFKDSLVKVEVALCRGKHTYDKKQSLKEKDLKRDTERRIKEYI